MNFEQRLAHRNQYMPEWLNGIWDKCRMLEFKVLPQSVMGRAVRYTVRQWDKLMVTAGDGEIELSTNVAENSMRPLALGRKNWLHIGSQQAGARRSHYQPGRIMPAAGGPGQGLSLRHPARPPQPSSQPGTFPHPSTLGRLPRLTTQGFRRTDTM